MADGFDINYFFKNYFAPACVNYGRELFLGGKVSRLSFRSGQAVGAMVRGTGAQTYRVNILLEQLRHTQGHIVGTCSCSAGFNCKHVAAVLFQLEADMDKASRSYEGFEKNRYKVWETWFDTTYSADSPYAAITASSDILLYVFSFGFSEDAPKFLFVDLYQTKALKKGGFSETAVKPAKLNDMKDLETLTAMDIQIIQQLRQYRVVDREDLGERFRLHGETPLAVIRDLVQTGRSFWQTAQTPLSWQEEPMAIHLEWHRLNHGGLKYLPHNVDNEIVSLWPITPFVYHHPITQAIGPINTTLETNTLRQCLTMPTYYPDQGEFLQTAFDAWAKPRHLPALPVAAKREEKTLSPSATLTLYSGDSARILLTHTTHASYQRYDAHYSYAKITFHYGNASCQPDNYEQNLYEEVKDTLFIYPRQWALEKKYLQQLSELGVYRFDEKKPIPVKPEYAHDYYIGTTKEDVLYFLQHAKEELAKLNWQIIYDDSFTHAPRVVYDNWYGAIEESGNAGWFSLEIGVVIDDEKTDLVPILAKLLQTEYAHYSVANILAFDGNELLELTLNNGKKIAIAMHRLQSILATLTELYDKQEGNGQLQINALLASQLASQKKDFSLPDIRWNIPPELHNASQKWASFPLSKHIVQPTENFKGKLRSYQLEGLTWLQFLRQYHLAGILADDMGLGKTVQTLAHLAMEKQAGRWQKPVLIICPTTLVNNWNSEIQRFTPDLSAIILQGNDRAQEKSVLQQHDIIITTYSVILHDQDLLAELSYYYIILDEAQWIKNANTKAFTVVTQLKTDYRLCLTGTPMENHLGELWSLFHFLLPGFLGSAKTFNKLFKNPIEKSNDEARKLALQKRIAPFLLRRAKQVVAADLPPKNEIIQLIDMDEEQATLYESIRLSVGNKIQKILEQKGFAQSHIEILDALLKLRQACCDPRLVKLAEAQKITQSAKLEYLLETIPEMIEEGRKILLFSSFTSMLSLIEAELNALSIPYVLLTGDTKDRQTPVAAFQNGEVPLFLLSLKAGGTGLNLTAADTVIHYDPWWNPAVENQASDRAHRIGQNKAVFIYKLITRGSVEEKIIHLQQKKQALLNDIFANTVSSGGHLELTDLEYLLAPMKVEK